MQVINMSLVKLECLLVDMLLLFGKIVFIISETCNLADYADLI